MNGKIKLNCIITNIKLRTSNKSLFLFVVAGASWRGAVVAWRGGVAVLNK